MVVCVVYSLQRQSRDSPSRVRMHTAHTLPLRRNRWHTHTRTSTHPCSHVLAGKSIQNPIMQMRQVCAHPYLFEEPMDDKGDPILDEAFVRASGKMMMLDRLLPRLRKEGHKASTTLARSRNTLTDCVLFYLCVFPCVCICVYIYVYRF